MVVLLIIPQKFKNQCMFLKKISSQKICHVLILLLLLLLLFAIFLHFLLILKHYMVRFTPQRFRPRQKLEGETFHRTCQEVKEPWKLHRKTSTKLPKLIQIGKIAKIIENCQNEWKSKNQIWKFKNRVINIRDKSPE